MEPLILPLRMIRSPRLQLFWRLCFLWLVLGLWSVSSAQIYDTNNVLVQSFVGSGFSGHHDGVGAQTMFNNPLSVVADSQSNLFVLENARIRKVSLSGSVSTFAGGGTGSLPGYGTNVSLGFFFSGCSLAIDRSDTIWVSDWSNLPYLLRIQKDGLVVRIQQPSAQTTGTFGGLCCDSVGNVYVADYGRHRVYRYLTNGVWEDFAGSGNRGSIDGNWIFSSFDQPYALAADGADNIYVWEAGSRLVRRISPNREVVTIAGNVQMSAPGDGFAANASIRNVAGMCADGSGNVILACGTAIRRLSAGTNLTTIAGSFTQSGYTNGPGSLARFKSASGVCFSNGKLFVADSGDHRIRQISYDPQPEPVSGGNLELGTYPGLKISGVVGRIYRIESSADAETWNLETSLLLTHSPYLWIDQQSLGPKKFYRAVLLP